MKKNRFELNEISHNSESTGIYKTYQTKIGIYKTKKEWEFISKFLPVTSCKILDAGGGEGRFAKRFHDLNHDVTNIDINSEAINISLNRGIKNSYCVDYKEYNQSDFDLVIAIEILMNEEPADLLVKVNQFLKLNGCFVFVAPNKSSWRYFLREFRKNRNLQKDLSYNSYIQLIDSYGFELIKAEGFMWMPLKVASNSYFVILFAFVEKILHLSGWHQQSPWIIYACKKTKNFNVKI